MKGYALYLIASLLFYASGVLSIANGNTTGLGFVALGCVFFALALRCRNRLRNPKD